MEANAIQKFKDLEESAKFYELQQQHLLQDKQEKLGDSRNQNSKNGDREKTEKLANISKLDRKGTNWYKQQCKPTKPPWTPEEIVTV